MTANDRPLRYVSDWSLPDATHRCEECRMPDEPYVLVAQIDRNGHAIPGTVRRLCAWCVPLDAYDPAWPEAREDQL